MLDAGKGVDGREVKWWNWGNGEGRGNRKWPGKRDGVDEEYGDFV